MEIYLNQDKVYHIDDEIVAISKKSYEIGDRMGSGGNGAVYECISQEGEMYAVKFLLSFSKKRKQRFQQEILLMKRLSNPHIIRYIDEGVIEGKNNKNMVHGQEILFVIMEKADSNLKDLLLHNSIIPYESYIPQFRGMCEALKELHQYAIHRDIKPENILIKGETWLLSDFGLCEFLDPAEHCDITGENEKVGPIFWISPEAANKYYFGKDEIGTYSDIYQMGMIFAFVIMKKFPAGMLDESSGLDTTKEMQVIILKTLANDYLKRPKDGGELLKMINEATIDTYAVFEERK